MKKYLCYFVLCVLCIFVISCDNKKSDIAFITQPNANTTSRLIAIVNFSGDTLEIPNTDDQGRLITEIDENTFSRQAEMFSTVKRLILPDGVTMLEPETFSCMTTLEEIVYGTGISREAVNRLPFLGTSLCHVQLKNPDDHYEVTEDGIFYTKNNNIKEQLLSLNGKICSSISLIKTGAFAGLEMDLGTYKIPGHIYDIGDYAFQECSFTDITVEEGVHSIGIGTFYGCNRLTSIQLPKSLEILGNSAFGQTAIQEIPFLGSITECPSYLFYGCMSLETAVIPEGIQKINTMIFASCRNLKKVYFPSTLRILEDNIFWENPYLEEIIVSNENLNYYSENNCLIDRQTQTLIKGGNTDIIPNHVKTIESFAFAWNDTITSLTISNNVERIKMSAFAECPNLQYLYIPDSVLEIEENAICPKNITIYCEAEEQPEGWEENWANESNTIYWGQKRRE